MDSSFFLGTNDREHEVCYVLWPWPISSRSFSNEFAIKLLKYVAHPVVSTIQHIQFWMNYFHIWHKWSLAWEGVSRVMTFDLDPYFQGYYIQLWPCLFCGYMWHKYNPWGRAHARHFENGVLGAYGTHCKHNYQRYHSYFCVHQQNHAYFADGTA